MAEAVFTGASLEEALRNDTLTPSAGLVITAMVKRSEQDGHISVTTGGCDAWIEIPTDMIDKAEHVGDNACRDHSHPVLRITLREAEGREARMFADLLGQSIPGLPADGGPPGFLGASQPVLSLVAQRAPGLGGTAMDCYLGCLSSYNACQGSPLECAILYAACSAICGQVSRGGFGRFIA
jgi:hypothetical protein